MQHVFKVCLLTVLLSTLAACSGGGGSDTSSGASSANRNCDGTCANQSLSVADVRSSLSRAVTGAEKLGVSATIAIVDRVGNVLAVYQMAGANTTTKIDGKYGVPEGQGLEGLTVPATVAAISKAGTGAYLSSQGNAFTSRTASQIVQENFYPGEQFQPGGPLFGVQFSQLACGDVTVLNPSFTSGIRSGQKTLASGLVGPRPLPLGLSADPGGIPLYKEGDVVGGIGVEIDGSYTLDREIKDVDFSVEEAVALYGSIGLEAPNEVTGDRIFAGGKTLRFTDVTYDDLDPLPETLQAIDDSRLQTVFLYTNGQIRDGAVHGSPESGIARTTRAGMSSMELVDGSGNTRFPVKSGSGLAGGVELKADEVNSLLDSAILTAYRARGAIRRPLDSPAHVTIFVVDTNGDPIGMTRTFDAAMFGIDVSLQKARTALFFSGAGAGDKLAAAGLGSYVNSARGFLSADPLSGQFAFGARSIGNLARPFFIDGINGNPNGPYSLPFAGTEGASRIWSPFNDGLQLDLVLGGIAQPLGIPANPPASLPDSCTSPIFGSLLRNGSQIFAGGVPLYRGRILIGAIGVSGDGIDQDDLISLFGASRKGLDYAGHTQVGDPVLGFNAPKEIRADLIQGPFEDSRLRYANCPESTFIEGDDQNVCEGL